MTGDPPDDRPEIRRWQLQEVGKALLDALAEAGGGEAAG